MKRSFNFNSELFRTSCVFVGIVLAGSALSAWSADLLITGDTVLGPDLTLQFDNVKIDNDATLTLLGSMTLIVNGELEVGENCTISANGTGFGAAAGPGAGTEWWRGGSYGGAGGGGPAIYGSAAEPVDKGSGGGESAGGGAIRIEVGDTAVIDGTISANGIDTCNGAGAGGTVYLLTSELDGNGEITAYGGNSTCGQGGGGGGRVVVYYSTSSFVGGVWAFGGAGGAPGEAGTVGFFDQSSPDVPALRAGHAWRFETGDPLEYSTITLSGTAATYEGDIAEITTGYMFIENAATLDLYGRTIPFPTLTLNVGSLSITGSSQVQGNLVIHATENVTIEVASVVAASGAGNPAGAGPGAGTEWWRGGSYGGIGGGGPATYGWAAYPTDFGSGGGESGSGGAIRLDVTGALTLNGVVAANGVDACNGAGSGGSVYITAGTLSGSGAIEATGGHSTCGQGGGGGGRIAVYCGNPASAFLGIANVSAGGGGAPGAPGTAAFFDTTVPDAHDLYSTGSWRFEAGDPTAYDEVLLFDCAATYAPNLTITADGFTMTGTSTLTAYSRGLPFEPLTLDVYDLHLQDTSQIEGNVTVSAAGSITVTQNAAIHADGIGYPASSGPGAGSEWFRGGSYGGRGGDGPAPYGSAVMPAEMGSGGGDGPGGGAIFLTAGGELSILGTISANGADVCNGAGAGGTINISTDILTGTGMLAANGGSSLCNQRSGGGGRIAVYYKEGAPSVNATADAGPAGVIIGFPGTVGFFDDSDPANVDFTSGPTWRFQNSDISLVSYRDVTLNGAAAGFEVNHELHAAGAVHIVNGATLEPFESLNHALELTCASLILGDSNSRLAGNVTVHAGAVTICPTCQVTADGAGYEPGSGPGAAGEWWRGGSHGGRGGSGAEPYGSAVAPVERGSGGGDAAGFGGGAIRLDISGALTIDGLVSATAPDVCDGAGAGGSIYITADEFGGTGNLVANGGNSTCGQSGGSGGRIAVHCASGDPLLAYANGGDTAGEPGTVGFFRGTGKAAGVDFISGPTWRFQLNDEGAVAYNNISIQDSAVTTYEDGIALTATGNVLLTDGGMLSVYRGAALPYTQVELACANLTVGADAVFSGNVAIDTGNLTVEALGAIRADGCGHPSGAGPGAATSWDSGGGYGGVGGGPGGGPTYGSDLEPVDPGSGGGTGDGGAGGGMIRVNAAGNIIVHGFLTADGLNPGNCSGGGSGGSIYLTCSTLGGVGGINANGGAADCGSFGGGGGRINVRYVENLYSGTLLALGSNGGADGTVMEMFLPTADFTAAPVVGSAPLEVLFTDASDPGGGQAIGAWLWNFGDGDTSEDQNPLHIYIEPGYFVVSLTVTTAAGSDTETKTDYILVNPTISGAVRANGAGLEGVTLAGLPGDPVSGPNGLYSAVVPLNWTGTVTPTLAGTAFDPVSRDYVNLATDAADQDYTAINPVISGFVSANGLGLGGVTLAGLPGNPVTGPDGMYSVEVPYDWTGAVTPTLAGTTFDPASRDYANLTAEAVDQDYAAVNPLISGIVTAYGAPLAGVILSGLPGDPMTGIDGAYSTEVPYAWTGTVTPVLENYAFEPESRSYAGVTQDQANQDYDGTILSHSADPDGDNLINLTELLRVIQFFNSAGFHCEEGTEDGYAPGPGDQTCTPHASDYAPSGPDWHIALTELLRIIQFYNSGGYHPCPGEGTEDGFCPGPQP